MEKRIVQTSAAPRIELNISANLSVKGWSQDEVVVKCLSADDLVMDGDGDEITIQCRDNTSLRVPYGTIFQDGHISGDVSIKSVEGTINFSKVAGNLSLRSIGDANIGSISGNLSARNIDGNLIVESCHGNVSVHDIQGNLIIEEKVTGNLSLKEIDGNAKAQVRGNISVELDPPPESRYEFHAKGNLVCRLPGDASARVNIAQASAISVKMPDVEVPDGISAPFEFLLGEGDASISISTSGRVSVASRPGDWDMGDIDVEIGGDFEVLTESLNEQITAQIEAQMEMMEEELEHQLDSLSISLEKTALSAEQAERIADRAREASERANRRAQEKIRRSQEKMQRKLEAARRRAERKARAAERAARDRRRRPEPPARPSMPSKGVAEPVSEEERLMILQMLEQGSISPEEAEQLLAALEGKSS
jgi:hypothetical protein